MNLLRLSELIKRFANHMMSQNYSIHCDYSYRFVPQHDRVYHVYQALLNVVKV